MRATYTQAPTTFSYSTETLNDLGKMNSLIYHNIEDCELHDLRYDSVSHKPLIVLDPTLTKTSPSVKLTSDHDEVDMISSAVYVNPELLVNHDDAPEYSDPIDLASIHNEP